jgi:hypothetical protein
MVMKIFWIGAIIVYLTIVVFVGTRKTKDNKLFFERIDNSIKNKSGKMTIWSIIRFVVTIILGLIVIVLFIPSLILNHSLSKRTRRKVDREVEDELSSGHLYHHRIGGAGVLSCQECGFEEKIISFTHGPPIENNGWCRTGYQCQECNKHITIYQDKENNPPLVCDCGGQLERGEPLRCSQCEGLNLQYNMEYIT